MSFEYEYPRPMVTVDILVLKIQDKVLKVLLIKRKHEPYVDCWALPGGFIEMTESLREAAARELHEETGLKNFFLLPLLQADDPQRDPRGRTISHLFGTLISHPSPEMKAGDDATLAAWFPIDHLPSLAFDHDDLVKRGVEEFKFQIFFRLSLLAFMNEKFSSKEWEAYGDVLFQRKEISSLLLQKSLKLKVIRKIDENLYQRSVSVSEIYSLSFSTLADIWLDQS